MNKEKLKKFKEKVKKARKMLDVSREPYLSVYLQIYIDDNKVYEVNPYCINLKTLNVEHVAYNIMTGEYEDVLPLELKEYINNLD